MFGIDGWFVGSRCEHSYMVHILSVTFQAAVHLGQGYSQNPRSIKNQLLKSVKQFFRTTEKLIKDQVEITGFVHDCYLRNVQDLLSDGKTLYERRFGIPIAGPVIPFGEMVEYHLISEKDLSRQHQCGPKVLPGMFLVYVLSAGRIWKGDSMVADIEELEQMDTSELHARRRNANEVLMPMKGDIFIFPVADGTVKISGGHRTWERPVFGTAQTEDENKIIFEENQTGLLQHHVKTEWKIFPYSTGLHWRYKDYRHTFRCDVGKTCWRLLERWWRKRIVRRMERFHKIHCMEWEATGWIYMVRRRRTDDLKTGQSVARDVETYVWCTETQRGAKVGNRDTTPDELKRTMKNVRRKVGISAASSDALWIAAS